MTQLVNGVAALFKGKKEILLFFKGAGVPASMYRDLSDRVAKDKTGITKFEIVRTVLERLNEAGDAALGARRQVLQRICDFEDFSHCWEDDVPKARAAVAEIRRLIDVKDSFTRMKQVAEAEQRRRQEQIEAENRARREHAERLDRIKGDLGSLFAFQDAQQRGKALERVLTRLFQEFGISIREPFTLRVDGSGIVEQIDGAVQFDGDLYLIEMKWWKEKLGPEATSQHLVRIFSRGDVRGIFISASGYTDASIKNHREALAQKVCFLCELQEIVLLLEVRKDLKDFLREKVQAAMIDKNPLHHPLARQL
jgi:hypothetical protein